MDEKKKEIISNILYHAAFDGVQKFDVKKSFKDALKQRICDDRIDILDVACQLASQDVDEFSSDLSPVKYIENKLIGIENLKEVLRILGAKE